MNLVQLKFPIGKYAKPETFSDEVIAHLINDIETFPQRLFEEVKNLTKEQLDTVYRPEGWTIRQVIHHCADSHMNSIIRFKLALTEEKPSIRPYFEDRWAELPDTKNYDIQPSLDLLSSLHKRWVVLLKSLTAEQLDRRFIHPEHENELTVKENIAIYAWHCNHHLAHITSLKERMDWK